MNRKATTMSKRKPMALAALKRAAQYAQELARQTQTPLWILQGGKLVDANQPPENDGSGRQASTRTKK